MNKIKNILSFLILFLSLAMVPAKGWGETAILSKDASGFYSLDFKNAFLDASNYYNSTKYKYVYFDFISNTGVSLNVDSWTFAKGTNSWDTQVGTTASSNCLFFLKDNTLCVDATKANAFWNASLVYVKPTEGVSLEGMKIIAHLSNDADFFTDHSKEEATYTYHIRLEENLADYEVKAAAEPANATSRKYVVDPTQASYTIMLDADGVKYMRWQVLDADGNAVNTVSSLLKGQTSGNYQAVKDKYVWAKFDTWEPNNVAQTSERTVIFTLPSGKTWDDGYQVVGYWATDKSDGEFATSSNNKVYFFQEPTLAGKCTFSFMSKTEADKAVFTPSTSAIVEKQTVIRATSDNTYTITMPNNTAKYMRWYVLDKDGSLVNGVNALLTPDGSATSNTYKTKDNYYIWYNKDKTAGTNDLKMTFTLPSGKAWTDGYQVVCAWASTSDGSEILYDNNTNYYLLKEPTLSSLFVTHFTTDEQIKGKDLVYGNLSKTAVDESDVYVVGDEATSVAVLLPNHQVQYVRWQVIEKSTGNIVETVGEEGNAILSNTNYANRKKGNLIYYNSSKAVNGEDVRKVTFDKSKLTGSWADYQLKAVWSSNLNGADVATLTDGTTKFVVSEPSVLEGSYVVNFKTETETTGDLKLSSAFSSTAVKESDLFVVDGNKVTVSVSEHFMRYIRWQLIDKEAGNVVETLPQGTLTSTSCYDRGKGNVIAYSATSNKDEKFRTITFDKSKLTTPKAWNQYQLKAVWTNDVSGMTSYVKVDASGKYVQYVMAEPSVMQGEYVVSFADKSSVGTLQTSSDPTTVKETEGVRIDVQTAGSEKKMVNINLNDKLDEILSVLGKKSVDELGNLYIRWTVTDAEGNSFKTYGFGIDSKKYHNFNENKDFNYLSKAPASELSNILKVSFAPTENLWEFDIAKVTNISCVITDDLTGLKETEGVVTTEPTNLKLKYTVKIIEPTDVPFRHYQGYANAANDYEVINAAKNQLRQKTYTWEYTYVVDKTAPNNTIDLTLPIEEYADETKKGHGALEPFGYFRWYNYDTDEGSSNLQIDNGDNNTYLHAIKDEQGNDKGLLAYNLPVPSGQTPKPWQRTVGVKYIRPTDANWQGENIACDVSRYVDGLDVSGSYMEHESTLTIRYIFHIIPASKMAQDVKDFLIDAETDSTYEDNKNVTVGLKEVSSTMTLRLNMKPTMYYFYPMTNAKHHVYFPAKQTKERRLTDGDFGKEIKKATHVFWRIYNGDRDRYFDDKSNVDGYPRFYDLRIQTLNNATWKDLDGNVLSDKLTFQPGDHFSVVAYAADEDDNSCPIANFNCRYFQYYPKRLSEMGNEDVTRRVSYLDENYKSVAVVSFDNDSPEQTLSAPTNGMDNQSQHPSSWTKRSYGFVYKDLIDKSAGGTSVTEYFNPKHSAHHGEYGIYKTANLTGVSTSSEGYLWHDAAVLHDRTWESTGGSQIGSFLYVDASDESRTIASAEFSADLCTGQQLAFSAGVADMTDQTTKPQLMFKLYGLDNGKKVLLHSFSSGDFNGNTNGLVNGVWYQVYGKVTLQKEAEAEKYSDFRIEIDNYSKGTNGADYCVDDIRFYVRPAQVEVYQDKPACGDSETGNIKLKIRAIHETLNALLGHKDTKIHFRFVNEDGTPVTGDGLYNYTLKGPKDTAAKDVKTDKSYASVDVFDSEATCKQYEIDGACMLETDADGETFIVLANHPFSLKKGKKYYVSVCTDSNPDAADANWGNPADVCSIYSDWFELVGQTPYISDSEGNVITEYRVDCKDTDAKITLHANLTTIDPKTGEKIVLKNVPFLWYIDQKTTPFDETPSNSITISVSTIGYGSHTVYLKPIGQKNADGENVYTVDGVSYLLCDEATPLPLRISKAGPQLNFGFRDVDYPFNDANYGASLRVGLPQIKMLQKEHKANPNKGYLLVPLHSASYQSGVTDKTLTFIDDNKQNLVAASQDIYVSATNDPTWNAEGANLLNQKVVATLKSKSIDEVGANGVQSTLDLAFSDEVVNSKDETQSLFHEGYWYELRFVYEQRGENVASTKCPGESYLKLKIVPEYVTWRPTADNGMNANWNNDANWHRSSSSELYKDDYIEYNSYADNSVNAEAANKVNIATIDNYVPMKFTKVTIDNLKGLPFPDLGNMVYRSSNGIATKLTNGKGNEATSYIQYDIMAYWDESDADKGLGKQALWKNGSGYEISNLDADHAGDMSCEKFYGNTCHQIYFKPQGELRDQCYLVYDKAWVEKELKPNTWYTMATPLQYIYAGDMYVPATSDAQTNGRQETEAFMDIKFDDTKYSRSKYPVYQRAWEKSGVEEITPNGNYPASHYPQGAKTGDMDLAMGYWSHIYNKVDESYADNTSFNGFSIKAGNTLLPSDKSKNALLRLPKEDASYAYYDYNGNSESGKSAAVSKPSNNEVVSSAKNSDGHGKFLVAYNNDEEKHLAPMTQSLNADGKSGFYLVANPYTCSISLKKFFEVNTDLVKQAWIVEGSEVKAIASDDFDKNDFAIQPTQSFFVKKTSTGEGGASEVKFTSAMYVDRLITSGLQMASDYIKTVNITTQNAKGQTSKARISLRAEASEGYDEQEDVDMLYDQNLQNIPQVYTVADGQAVAVNAVPSISWMPLGIVSEEKQDVKLTLTCIAKLSAPLYLYDAASASYTLLHEGEAISVEAGEHGRYFLTQSRGTVTGIDSPQQEDAADAHVKVYSPAAGMIVASALAGETLGRVEVFTLDGKLVHRYEMPGHQRMILRVPSGVYVVKATTEGPQATTEGSKAATEGSHAKVGKKIAVR